MGQKQGVVPRVAVALRWGGPKSSKVVSSTPHGQVRQPVAQAATVLAGSRGLARLGGDKACIEAGIHTSPVHGTRFEAAWMQRHSRTYASRRLLIAGEPGWWMVFT